MDLSKWQHPGDLPLEWTDLSTTAPGFRFVYVKASEGAGTLGDANPFYDLDVAAAKASGAYVGAYHYAGPGLPVVKDAKREARNAIRAAGKPQPGDLPLALDLESNPDGLTPEQMARWALTWLTTVHRATGRTPVFYTYPSFFETDVAPRPAFGTYPLWVAHYGVTLDEPTVPAPWATWTFWQHSSQGELPGTYGPVDLDVYAGSRAELARLAGISYTGVGVDAAGVSLLGDAMLTALTDDAPTTGR